MKAKIKVKEKRNLPNKDRIISHLFREDANCSFVTNHKTFKKSTTLSVSLNTWEETDISAAITSRTEWLYFTPEVSERPYFLTIETEGKSLLDKRGFYRAIELFLIKGKGNVSIDDNDWMNLETFQKTYHDILSQDYNNALVENFN